MSVRIPFLTMTILACAACASGTTPNAKAESSSAAIRAAEEGGGTHGPNSALYLQLAKEEFAYAQQLPNPKDKDRADRQLRRAEVDAELSLALARSEEEKVEAKTAIDKVKKLNASAAQ